MLKAAIGLLTALFVAGFPLAYAQDVSSPDFKVLTDARIGIVKAALQLVPGRRAALTVAMLAPTNASAALRLRIPEFIAPHRVALASVGETDHRKLMWFAIHAW
jgi:hypothetical protein